MTPDAGQFRLHPALLRVGGKLLMEQCHGQALAGGCWSDLDTGADLRSVYGVESPKRNIPEMLRGVQSLLGEAIEGERHGLPDDKLPHRPKVEVRLADAVIRCFDLAGGLSLDLAGAIAEKLSFNARQADNAPKSRHWQGP
jgi:hypothetical protein